MNFKEQAEKISSYIIEKRRWIHSHAELSFNEKETTAYIAGELEKMGMEVCLFSDYYGVIGTIHGDKPGKTVMLRADIDALPIEEKSGVEFASNNKGVMHACGHDCHSSMLLGAARMLAGNRKELCGTVKILFQSAEESCHGANYYIEKGYLDDVDALLGIHVWASMKAGAINIEDGYRMAFCDNFKITVEGSSVHGSTPHLGKDAIVAASSIIMNLQTFVSRENDPLNPMVVTVGTVKAGKQFNIIADRVEMEGTIRTYGSEMREKVQKELGRIVCHTAEALGCKADFVNTPIEPPVVNNNIEINEIARDAAKVLYGKNILRPMPKVMGSEDMSILMQKVPGVMCFIGYYNEACGSVYPLHSDSFCVDEGILPKGAALYAQFAHDYLQKTAMQLGKGGQKL